MALYGPEARKPITSGGVLVAGLALSTANGTHVSTVAQIDSTAPTGLYYVHLLQGNAGNAIPGDGAYAAGLSLVHAPIAWSHTSGLPDVINLDDNPTGTLFAGGLWVILSTTPFTKTAAAYLIVDSVIA